MAQIHVNNLTFYYEGSFDNIFEKVSFSIDTDWKLGFIGRNGKGKTTFLNLLLGKYEYTGSITTNTVFDYFPYHVKSEYLEQSVVEFIEEWKVGVEQWRVICELDKLGLDAEVLYRPFGTLSFGERTKVMLAVLFSGENDFLLIDEPTNHLDRESREIVKQYLAGKQGFILVSHDRDFLDACIDHVLVLNRQTIEVQVGNFSSWWENKSRKDAFSRMENEKHLKEISKLKVASERARKWAEKSESTKIGYDPIKEHDRSKGTRSYIGAKTKKMESRVKQYEHRIEQEIEETEGLLQDIENPVDLKLMPLKHHKERLVTVSKYGLKYADAVAPLFEELSFEIKQGDRVFLNGANGCGKSSLIKVILQNAWEKGVNKDIEINRESYVGKNGRKSKESGIGNVDEKAMENSTGKARENSIGRATGKSIKMDGKLLGLNMIETGLLETASGLIISYINQDTSFLHGNIKNFCREHNLDESLFCAILRQLDMERVQFGKNMENFSEGQKKKILIAASLLTSAHLYIWDEPLNYIDVFSRMQIEKLLLTYQPTMLVVDHDVRFREKIATKVVEIG